MDVLFFHVGSAVLPCQSPRSSGFESGRADDAGRDWLPYAGRALGEGRAAVLQQQSLGCVFASLIEKRKMSGTSVLRFSLLKSCCVVPDVFQLGLLAFWSGCHTLRKAHTTDK